MAGDTLASLVAIVVVGGSLALHGVVVGRAFGDAVLGHAGLALAVGLGLPQIAGAGLVPAITRFTAARRAAGDVRGARRAALGAFAVLVTAGVVCATFASLARESWAPRIGLPAAEVSPTLALVALESMYIGLKAILYGANRARSYARYEAMAGLGFLAALAWLAMAPAEARPPLVTPFLVADVIFVLLAVSVLRAVGEGGAMSSGDGAESSGVVATGIDVGGMSAVDGGGSVTPVSPGIGMARYAALASVGAGASIARLRLVPIGLGLVHGAGEVGLLHAALVFFGPVMLVPRAVELALFPALAGAHGRGERVRFGERATVAARAIALGLALIAGGLVVAGPALVGFAYGPGFEAAAGPLIFVILAAWSLGLAVPAIVALSGADGIATVNTAGVLGLVTSVIAWALLIPPFGALGAAAGFALGSVPTALIPIRAAAIRYGVRWRPAASTSAIAVTTAAALAWAVRDGGTLSIGVSAVYVVMVLALTYRGLGGSPRGGR